MTRRERLRFTLLTGPDGELIDRLIEPGTRYLHPGKAWVSSGYLRYTWDRESVKYCEARDSKCLNEFIALWKSENPEVAIAHFANRWGPLRFDSGGSRIGGVWDGRTLESEDLNHWIFLSRRAEAICILASKLGEGRRGGDADWRTLSVPDDTGPLWSNPLENIGLLYGSYGFPNLSFRMRDLLALHGKEKASLDDLRLLLADELSFWIVRFCPQLGVGLDAQSGLWSLEIRYVSVASAIAMQLALTVIGGELYLCSACGIPYTRIGKRRPNKGQQNYCPRCGVMEAMRIASQRRRDKMAEARRFYAEGLSVAQISDRLKTKTATVSRWLRGRKTRAKKARIG